MAPTPAEAPRGAPSPMAALLRAAAAPAAWAYGRAIARRNRRFDAGVGVRRLGVPVVSVGNIVVGGAGKTPTVTWLARMAIARGVRPMIALRGYGSRDPRRADEALEYRDALGDVPIAAGADRFATITRALGDVAVDVVLLDDGFQHRRLHRDLDLVLLDARRPALDDSLLPQGRLREPPASLRRADGVIVTRAAAIDPSLALAIERVHGRPPLAWLRHAWRAIDVHVPGTPSPRVEPVEWLRGRRVVTSLGVAGPAGVAEMLEDAGAVVVADVPARDHQPYGPARLRRLGAACAAGRADAALVTSKDWVKLREAIAAAPGVLVAPVAVPRLEIECVAGEADVVAALMAATQRR